MQERRRIVPRLIHAMAFCALSVALAIPSAHAAERKKTTAKKPAASSVSAKQRPAARSAKAVPRKAVTRVKATRVMSSSARLAPRMAAIPERQSFGQVAGLHAVQDPLELKSSVALVIDQETHEVLLSKNDHAVLPIASLTKLMTGLLVSQAKLPMDETITITQDDVDTEKFSSSRLAVGTTLTRGEMLHLALMSSENRAAHALGRTFPGGMDAFVAQMNAKAKLLGMTDTRYVEPTGLSSRNQSSARDLATLVNIAHADPLLRELTTSPSYEVAVGRRTLQYNNTNRLVKNPAWDIGLQKTGYISEAGRCLVMQTHIAGRKLIMVFLDSAGKFSRLGDAERVRNWVEKLPSLGSSATLHAVGAAKLE
ncbi:D-alanyl-D-alanine endopeptidase [Acidovorax sp. NCPPB 4044]|uniref:D-alanyl-D-alanine endopeptidase n=1 Tax=Acidovorax sp. NCPPB 4044 TaxID=2940490 RepID=UPI00230431C9|nr:D-alanyl-D-alanine endopeptidase [Acidovorax sp. NCPPB 4044]MDA8520746.1 D-alanyl-D-alanine endopeptidase [Acidovorax sp. NCPPB 4044]